MKLGVWIPLGNMPRAFFDFRDLTYFEIFIGGVSYKTTSHITRVWDLTYCSLSTYFPLLLKLKRSKLKKITKLAYFVKI
jgi:hypothetical protein